jgi:hypothetical protein
MLSLSAWATGRERWDAIREVITLNNSGALLLRDGQLEEQRGC